MTWSNGGEDIPEDKVIALLQEHNANLLDHIRAHERLDKRLTLQLWVLRLVMVATGVSAFFAALSVAVRFWGPR